MYTNMFEQLGDRNSTIVRDALTRKCILCNAPPDNECTNLPINSFPLSGRLVHLARTSE